MKASMFIFFTITLLLSAVDSGFTMEKETIEINNQQPPKTKCQQFLSCCGTVTDAMLVIGEEVLVHTGVAEQIRKCLSSVAEQNPAVFNVLISLANNQKVEENALILAKPILQPLHLMDENGNVSQVVKELVKVLVPQQMIRNKNMNQNQNIRVRPLTVKQAIRLNLIAYQN